MRGRSNSGKRKHYGAGEITFHYVLAQRVGFGRVYDTWIRGFAEILEPNKHGPGFHEYGEWGSRKECEEIAHKQSKRAVFEMQRNIAGHPVPPRQPPKVPPTPLELCEARLSEEQLKLLNEMLDHIQKQERQIDRIHLTIKAEDLFAEQAVLACKELYADWNNTELKPKRVKACGSVGGAS